jgi:hypothetical protein
MTTDSERQLGEAFRKEMANTECLYNAIVHYFHHRRIEGRGVREVDSPEVIEHAIRETVARFSDLLDAQQIRQQIKATLAIGDGLVEHKPRAEAWLQSDPTGFWRSLSCWLDFECRYELYLARCLAERCGASPGAFMIYIDQTLDEWEAKQLEGWGRDRLEEALWRAVENWRGPYWPKLAGRRMGVRIPQPERPSTEQHHD